MRLDKRVKPEAARFSEKPGKLRVVKVSDDEKRRARTRVLHFAETRLLRDEVLGEKRDLRARRGDAPQVLDAALEPRGVAEDRHRGRSARLVYLRLRDRIGRDVYVPKRRRRALELGDDVYSIPLQCILEVHFTNSFSFSAALPESIDSQASL